MEYRRLGASGLKVPVLSFGAGTFGGSGPLFGHWGTSDAVEARRLVDICLEAGVNLFDTADVYSNGASEEVLGEAIKGRRDQILISTKTSLPMGDGPNDAGSSRPRLIKATEDALRRLGTDYIDLLQLHAFDAFTPVEEVDAGFQANIDQPASFDCVGRAPMAEERAGAAERAGAEAEDGNFEARGPEATIFHGFCPC